MRAYVSGSIVAGPGWLRACMLTVIGADIFVCGNVAVIVHGTIALCAVLLYEYPACLALAIIGAATIKPIFLVYNAVFLLHPMRLGRKVFYSAISVLGGLAPFVIFMRYNPHLFAQDMSLLHYYALVDDRGPGFLNLAGFVGLRSVDLRMAALYGLFVAILVSAAIYIVTASEAPVRARIWIGVTVSILADPRLMFYDFLTVGAGLVSVVGLSRHLGRPFSRAVNWYVVTLCVVSSILNSRGGQYGLYLFVPGAYLLIVGIASGFLLRGRRGAAVITTAPHIYGGAASHPETSSPGYRALQPTPKRLM